MFLKFDYALIKRDDFWIYFRIIVVLFTYVMQVFEFRFTGFTLIQLVYNDVYL